MQNAALAELRDIHLPAAVSFWPLPVGWWLVAAAAVALVVAAWLWQRWRRASARRAALLEVVALERNYRADADVSALAQGLSSLLRRLALVRFDRHAVASLHGSERAAFLAGAKGAGFSAELATSLERAVYGAKADAHDADAWIVAARRWIGRRP